MTQVAAIFDEIYSNGKFRIYQMRLIDDFEGNDDRSIAANNTSGFNCRTTDHGALSKHALGLAIDINPVQNPYREGAVTAPEAGKAYDEPQERRIGVTGIILEDDVVARAFAARVVLGRKMEAYGRLPTLFLSRPSASNAAALTAHLQLLIEKLRRGLYGGPIFPRRSRSRRSVASCVCRGRWCARRAREAVEPRH